MIRCIGGPYDGQDIPLDEPYPVILFLPEREEFDQFIRELSGDPERTALRNWPYRYNLDSDSVPACYRSVG